MQLDSAQAALLEVLRVTLLRRSRWQYLLLNLLGLVVRALVQPAQVPQLKQGSNLLQIQKD
jgi:hypothetical protein